jgi:hypothetical protein
MGRDYFDPHGFGDNPGFTPAAPTTPTPIPTVTPQGTVVLGQQGLLPTNPTNVINVITPQPAAATTSTGTYVAYGVGAVAVGGLAAYYLSPAFRTWLTRVL